MIIGLIMLLTTQAMPAQTNAQLRDSLKLATERLAYYPDSIDLRLKKASWNIRLEQWEYAKEDLDKILNSRPTDIAGLYFRAFVNEKLKRFNFARLDYENLLYLVPGNFQAQLGLALLNQKDQHLTEAFDQINQMVETYPDSAIVYAARGGIEKERQMYELAEFDYAEAMKRDTENIDYIINHIDLCIILKKNEQAIEELYTLEKRGVPRARLKIFYDRIRKG
uniref:Tetratricopeptide repeat protein n=1 Tax=Prevotella sp. GTC17260 TaxID=3236796 RepID=A0AB33JEN8_9BACT